MISYFELYFLSRKANTEIKNMIILFYTLKHYAILDLKIKNQAKNLIILYYLFDSLK